MAHTPKKAVVDTNILVSSFVFPDGLIREIITMAINKQAILIVSEQIISEYAIVLKRKFKWTDERISSHLAVVRKLASVNNPEITLNAVPDDPTDNKVIECAVDADADCIISGDRHLLDIGKYRGISILTPAEFIIKIRKSLANPS